MTGGGQRRGSGRGAQWAMGAVMLASLALAGGCFHKGKGVRPAPAPVVIEARNRGFFDVDVYVLPSAAGNAMRLGSVTGFSDASFVVRAAQLQAGGTLQVRLHGIGTAYIWDSPGVAVSPGDRVALDIYTDADGNLARSVLYPLASGDTSPAASGAGGGKAGR